MTTPLDPKYDPDATVNRFSGIFPNNDYPLVNGVRDEVQERQAQARQEGARTRRESSDTPRDPHPPFTERYTTNDHAARSTDTDTAVVYDEPTTEPTADVVA